MEEKGQGNSENQNDFLTSNINDPDNNHENRKKQDLHLRQFNF
jgi:hypothetical protein